MEESLRYWQDEGIESYVVEKLTNGKVVLGTSDTVLGLLAEATERGRFALDNIKQRMDKPYIILIGGVADVQKYAQPPSESIARVMHACWPGPLTIVLPARPDLPLACMSPENTVALRIPAHAGLQTVLERVPGVFSTSANISGEPVPEKVQSVSPRILEAVSAVVLDRQNSEAARNVLPSTIVRVLHDDLVLLRSGACAVRDIEEAFGKKLIRSVQAT